MSKYKSMLAGAIIMAVPALSLAGAVNIDVQGDQYNGGLPGWWTSVGTYDGMAVATNVGTNWNGTWYPPDWVGNVVAPLVDDQGNVTDVQWSSSGTRDHWSYDNGTSGILMGDYAFNGDAFVGDGTDRWFSFFTDAAVATNGNMAITAGQAYDVYLYGVGDTSGASTFQIGAVTQTVNYAGGFDGTFTEGVDYVKFAAVAATATTNGAELKIYWGGDGANAAALNGVQIVEAGAVATEPKVGLYIIK